MLGLAILTGYLFCPGNLDDVLSLQETLGYSFLFVFQTGTGSAAGSAIMGITFVILGVCRTVGALTSSSRMVWSFARDWASPYVSKVIPLSLIWKFEELHVHSNPQLDRPTSIPIYSIALTTTVSVLLSLINARVKFIPFYFTHSSIIILLSKYEPQQCSHNSGGEPFPKLNVPSLKPGHDSSPDHPREIGVGYCVLFLDLPILPCVYWLKLWGLPSHVDPSTGEATYHVTRHCSGLLAEEP